eukprot:scaffold209699_cov18-Tisochrysis_lutea.AAC.2
MASISKDGYRSHLVGAPGHFEARACAFLERRTVNETPVNVNGCRSHLVGAPRHFEASPGVGSGRVGGGARAVDVVGFEVQVCQAQGVDVLERGGHLRVRQGQRA